MGGAPHQRNGNSTRKGDTPMYSGYEGPTVLGIPEKWERVLCYVLGWFTGIIFLLIEQRNHNVRRHAAQSTLVFASLGILGWIVGILHGLFNTIPVIGTFLLAPAFGLVGWLIGVVTVLLWIVLIIMAYLRPDFVLPLGRTYERLLG